MLYAVNIFYADNGHAWVPRKHSILMQPQTYEIRSFCMYATLDKTQTKLHLQMVK